MFVFIPLYINVRENRRGQSRLDNPETLTTLGRKDKRRRQTKPKNTTQKTKKISNPGSRAG